MSLWENRQITWESSTSIYRCRCGCEAPPPVQLELLELDCTIWELLQELEIDAGCRLWLYVTSGHRCKKYNYKVGGARRSQHMLGTAADIIVCRDVDGKRRMRPSRVFRVADRLMRTGLITMGGLHDYRGFTHVDGRGRRARW